MAILKLLAYITFLLPLIFFLLNYKKSKNTISRVVFLYIAYSVCNEILMILLSIYGISLSHPNLQPSLYALFTVIEFFFLGYYLYLSLSNKYFKYSLGFFSILFLFIAIYNFYYNIASTIKSTIIDTIPVSTSALILIIYSILFLFEQIQNPRISFIYSNPNFWVIIGIMVYFSGTFFLFLQYSDLSNTEKSSYWTINLICIILKNIFFSISFLLDPLKNEFKNSEGSIFKEIH